MNLVVCQNCERALRIQQELWDAKLKCRFCGAIFVGSAQSAEGAIAAATTKPQKRSKPMRYVRVRRKVEVIETPPKAQPAEIFETSNPEIAKRPEMTPAQQQQPRIAALKADLQVTETTEDTAAGDDSYQPTPKPTADSVVETTAQTEAETAAAKPISTAAKPVKKREIHIPQPAAKPVDKLDSEPQETTSQEVVGEQNIESPKTMDNQQLTPNSQAIETRTVNEPPVEVPVVIAPVEKSAGEPENSASPTVEKSQKLKWIIAAAGICVVGGIVWAILINL